MQIDNSSHQSSRTVQLSRIKAKKNKVTSENINGDMKEYEEVYERMIKLYGAVVNQRYNILTNTENNRYFGRMRDQ